MEWFVLLLLILMAIGMFFRGIVALIVTIIATCGSDSLWGIVIGMITYVLMYIIFPEQDPEENKIER